MKKNSILKLVLIGCALSLLVGCASTKVSNQQSVATGLPRPNRIWVYDFAATAAQVPPDSAMATLQSAPATPQTSEDVAKGTALGEQIARGLVEQINAMGLPAGLGQPGSNPQLNDIVFRGYLVSVNEGDAAKRVAIGFGAGSSELTTAVEGFQMTPSGLRKIGSGTVDAGGSKSPGAAVGVATFAATANPAGLIVSSGMKVYGEASGSSKVEGRAKATSKEIADVLKKRFQREGWIN